VNPWSPRACALLVLSSLLLAAPSVASARDQELLDLLLENGSITPEQHQELVSGDEPVAEEADESAPDSAGDEESESSGIKVSVDKKGLRVKTEDGRFEFGLGGRLHADATLHVGDTPGNTPTEDLKPTDGTEIRRARLAASARVFEDWKWVGEIDFADNETALKDFTIAYTGFENLKISAGHQKQPYSLSLEMSSNDIPFVERSIDNEQNILLDRAIGLRVDAHGDHWFFATGIFGDGADPQKANGDEGWGVTARAIVAPIIEENAIVHLGFRGAYRRPDQADKEGRLRDETTHMSNYRVVDTGVLTDLDNITFYGPEAAFAWGPVWVSGEYSRARLQRNNGFNTRRFESGHIAASWMLTGESRAKTYKISSGEFKRIEPRNNFSIKKGRWGAWELAMRYAYIDLNDGSANDPSSVNGGEEQVLSTALNWHLNYNVRLMLNWNHILETSVSDTAPIYESNREAKGLDVFTLRAQFSF